MDGPDANGVWNKVVTLTPGTHRFKFNIDGATDKCFAPDWAAKDGDGNGVIAVDKDGDVTTAAASSPAATEEKSTAANGQKVTFQFTAPDATTVYLAGDFNNWADNNNGTVSDSKFAMTKADGGVWQMEVSLTPGKHSYKFVVDGNQWKTDPSASEADSSGNSVIEVK